MTSISDNSNHILELIRSLPTECNPSDFGAFSGQVNQITSISDLIPDSNPLKRVLQLIIKMHVQNGASLIKALIKKKRYGLKPLYSPALTARKEALDRFSSKIVTLVHMFRLSEAFRIQLDAYLQKFTVQGGQTGNLLKILNSTNFDLMKYNLRTLMQFINFIRNIEPELGLIDNYHADPNLSTGSQIANSLERRITFHEKLGQFTGIKEKEMLVTDILINSINADLKQSRDQLYEYIQPILSSIVERLSIEIGHHTGFCINPLGVQQGALISCDMNVDKFCLTIV